MGATGDRQNDGHGRLRAAILKTEMTEVFRVRRLRLEDELQLQALYARTRNPYREEDAAAVSAHHRAEQAREAGYLWSVLPGEVHHVPDGEHHAFWVAEPLENGSAEIIGTVGLRVVGDSHTADVGTVEFSGLLSADEWVDNARVGEVRRLRVSPQRRRLGVGTALMCELISFSARDGLRSLLLNTTSGQLPALALYASLGFREIGRSYLDVYELVWMHLTLPAVSARPEAKASFAI
jgi:ribosomal protein S18 acetylase RimI-like enzyme